VSATVAGPDRPVAVVTGAGRRAGIAFAVAERLARDGFDVAFSWWQPYDRRMAWGPDDSAAEALRSAVEGAGGRAVGVEIDLEDVASAARLFDLAEALGPVQVLVVSHCESVDSDLLGTTVESFDRHLAVNARATWLLVRELALRFRSPVGTGRIVALTSDHTVGNLPYGASKGAMDRIVLAAARELARVGITANVVNPGATDTGWISPGLRADIEATTPAGRVGTPADVANLVSFLCSPQGAWVNGQLLHSDGGASAP
jgi:3-oxoacyl-[acyl-carrier protein] reductase